MLLPSNVVEYSWREASPGECCGVLLGRHGEVVEAVRVRNLSDNRTRYLLDPAGHLAAQRDGRARGVDVLGFYHSHPHSPAVPSETDVAEAAVGGSEVHSAAELRRISRAAIRPKTAPLVRPVPPG